MNQNKFLRLTAIILYIGFAAASCYATVESLRFLFPKWPVAAFWIATVGIFILASLSVSWVCDSFSKSKIVDNRGFKLFAGLVGVLLFWIMFSLTTNTHTLFYKTVIDDYLAEDLKDTRTALGLLENDATAEAIIYNDAMTFEGEVRALLGKYCDEIDNPQIKGHGERAERVLQEISNKLGYAIQPIKQKGNTLRDRQEIKQMISSRVDELLSLKLREKYYIRLENLRNKKNREDIKKNLWALDRIQDNMASNLGASDEPTEGTILVLRNSYNILRNYTDALVVEFSSENNSEYAQNSVEDYAAKNKKYQVLPETVRLRSVVDMWKDYFTTDKYDGRGFFYCIIIAALIDIAAFLFFRIATKEDE